MRQLVVKRPDMGKRPGGSDHRGRQRQEAGGSADMMQCHVGECLVEDMLDPNTDWAPAWKPIQWLQSRARKSREMRKRKGGKVKRRWCQSVKE